MELNSLNKIQEQYRMTQLKTILYLKLQKTLQDYDVRYCTYDITGNVVDDDSLSDTWSSSDVKCVNNLSDAIDMMDMNSIINIQGKDNCFRVVSYIKDKK